MTSANLPTCQKCGLRTDRLNTIYDHTAKKMVTVCTVCTDTVAIENQARIPAIVVEREEARLRAEQEAAAAAQ